MVLVIRILVIEVILYAVLILLLILEGLHFSNALRSQHLNSNLNHEIKLSVPLLSMLYYTQGSIGSLLKSIHDNKHAFRGTANVFTKHVIELLFDDRRITANAKKVDFPTNFGYLNKILQEPESILSRIDDYISGLKFEAEIFEQKILSVDEKISLVLFLDFFVPFILIFFTVFNPQYIHLTLAFFLAFSFVSTYYTSRLIRL